MNKFKSILIAAAAALIFLPEPARTAGGWEKIDASGAPSARYGSAMVEMGDVFVVGGYGKDINRIYSYRDYDDVDAWVSVDVSGGPGNVGGHCALMLSKDSTGWDEDNILIHGGSVGYGEVPVSTYVYVINEDGYRRGDSSWGELDSSGAAPKALSEHAAAYINNGYFSKTVFFYGGRYDSGESSLKISSDTYQLVIYNSSAAWRAIVLPPGGDAPPPLYGHAINSDRPDGDAERIFISGGKKTDGSFNNDIYILDVNSSSPKWESKKSGPAGIYGHSAMINGPDIYIYGGRTAEGINSAIYRADINDWNWETEYTLGDIPPGRWGQAAFSRWDFFAVFGGMTDDGADNGFYKYYPSFSQEIEDVAGWAEDKPYNAPNPFNPDEEETNIVFYLEEEPNSDIEIKIFTLTGYEVKSWTVSGREGLNQTSWDGKNSEGKTVANGGYVCLIKNGAQSRIFKIAILR